MLLINSPYKTGEMITKTLTTLLTVYSVPYLLSPFGYWQYLFTHVAILTRIWVDKGCGFIMCLFENESFLPFDKYFIIL